MAYGIKWTIAFQSVGGTDYTVNILQNGFTGTAKRLQPAESPFTINESRSDDYFEPIRTQSGYIRIINDATDLDGNTFSYKELIATNDTSHMVKVMSGQTLVWIGFIKPVVLTSTLFGYRNEVEIPVQCPLAVLQTINLKFGNSNTFPTMAQIFHMFFSRLDIAWGNLYLTANINHSSNYKFPDLNACVNMFNFSDNEDPTMSPGYTFDNYSCEWEDETRIGEILEKICKFFGWSLYTRGLNIYLIAPGLIHDYYEIPFSSLSSILTARTIQAGATPTDIEDLSYKSANHNEEYLQGYRKIKITANANSDDLVMDPFLKDLDYEGFGFYTFVGNTVRYYCAQAWLQNPAQEHRIFNHNVRIFTNPASSGDAEKFNILCWYDTWKAGPSNDYPYYLRGDVKNSFNLKQGTNVYVRSGEPSTPTTRAQLEDQTVLAITTLQEVLIPESSQLCIYAGVKVGINPTTGNRTSYDDYIRAYLRIGNKWWNGNMNEWSDQMSTFKMYCNDNDELLTTKAIYNQATLNDSALYPDAKGYIIQNASPAKRGVLEFGILNYPHNRNTLYFMVTDFNIRCVVSDITVTPQNKEEQEYEDVASLEFQDDLSVSLDMASGTKNLFGKGQLYNSTATGERVTGFSYVGESSKAPEQHLLDNMKRVFGQLRHRMSIEVAENAVHANPLTRFSYNGKNYIMQCASHDYANDKMVLTLIEE